jgi:zinc transporter ZupT
MVHELAINAGAAGLEFLQQNAATATSTLTFLAREQWPTWANALVFGLVSSITLPIGAMAGIYYAPVNEGVVAGFLAFGAGALLFAVTVELYGEALHELERDGFTHGATEICVLVFFAILGAWGYLLLNRWMDKVLSGDSEHSPAKESTPLKPSPRTEGGATSSQHAHGEEEHKKPKLGIASVLKLKAMAKKVKLLSRARLEKMAGRQKAFVVMMAAPGGEKKMKLAMAMWLGVLADGVPESILLGFLAAERRLSLVLVLSLLIANFPESFSASSMLKEAVPGFQNWKIVGMWLVLSIMTGTLACVACMLYPVGDVPFWVHLVSAAIEGLAGGAMLSCIASVMLPEAYEMQGDVVGLLCVTGFLLAVLIKVFGGVASEVTSGTWADKHIKHPEKGVKAGNGEAHGHHFLFFF